jgi:membrane protease YdiL (CAAX protease family)
LNLPDQPVIGLMFFAIGLALVPVATHLVRRLVPEDRAFIARWGFSHIVMVILFGVAAMASLSLIGPAESTIGLLVQTLFVLSVASLAAAKFANDCEPLGWRALGLPAGGDPKALMAAGISFMFVLPVLLGALILWPILLEWSGTEVEPQPVMQILLSMRGPDLIAGVLIAVVFQPFLEEVLFRGFLQPLLVQKLSNWGGVITTSALFALIHGFTAFLPIFILSMAIGGIMLRTRRLSAAWFLHALHNGTALGINFMLENGRMVEGT